MFSCIYIYIFLVFFYDIFFADVGHETKFAKFAMYLIGVIFACSFVCGSGSRVCVPADPGDRTVSILLAVIPGAPMLVLWRIVAEHQCHDYYRRDT